MNVILSSTCLQGSSPLMSSEQLHTVVSVHQSWSIVLKKAEGVLLSSCDPTYKIP